MVEEDAEPGEEGVRDRAKGGSENEQMRHRNGHGTESALRLGKIHRLFSPVSGTRLCLTTVSSA
ncbi:MAG: hypothetical protein AMXMBFR47_41300 [Planctomycetota bacterium]